ncbi:2-phosphosulfolactate phosphatase [Evansella clarkii]|uniref:2-phosphosulfolactate phosphatase n=1 Tax=Evansella clarkii TaxID=79879 RepID=UPI0009966353|nr:2-phosphosulfolactate phosphatase [Evansella clarkii]
MQVSIVRGFDKKLNKAETNIVIDVIRAFTVAHYALSGGAEKIILVKTVQDALDLKKANPRYIAAGEVKGLPVEGFDIGNSPAEAAEKNLEGETLILKTTNGVTAALNYMNADSVYVTGYSNAGKTAAHVKKSSGKEDRINIIASHPEGDDDFACAQYMHGIITGAEEFRPQEIERRIMESEAAMKFYDKSKPEFNEDDISYCSQVNETNFIMEVKEVNGLPTIVRLSI